MITYNIDRPESTYIIERTENGFVVHTFEQYSDSPDYFRLPKLFPLPDEDKTKTYWEGIADFLWGLLEKLEIYGSHHHPARLEIKVIKQSPE